MQNGSRNPRFAPDTKPGSRSMVFASSRYAACLLTPFLRFAVKPINPSPASSMT